MNGQRSLLALGDFSFQQFKPERRSIPVKILTGICLFRAGFEGTFAGAAKVRFLPRLLSGQGEFGLITAVGCSRAVAASPANCLRPDRVAALQQKAAPEVTEVRHYIEVAE